MAVAERSATGSGREGRSGQRLEGDMQILRIAAFVLLVIGGLNWALVGLFQWNLVEAALGAVPIFERLVYVVVGAAAVFLAATPDTWRRLPALA
jgi:uncharacterized membrane protein YuzA (DUF378 family)